MFSQTSEYALRAVVCLAARPDESMTTQEIAKVTKVPQGYLAKVLQALSRGKLVQSQRGLHGGFVLSQPPEEIRVLDVINSVDPLKHIHTCPLGIKAHGKKLCPLHQRMENAIQMIEQTFMDTTLADLLAEETTSKPLCEGLLPAAV